jgi:hypothetical protein
MSPTTAKGDQLRWIAAWRPVRRPTYSAWSFVVVYAMRFIAALQISVAVDAVASVLHMTDPAPLGRTFWSTSYLANELSTRESAPPELPLKEFRDARVWSSAPLERA